MYIKIFNIISPWKYLNILESPSPKNALCQVWLKLAQWFLRRTFQYFTVISPWKSAWPFIWPNLSPLHLRMLCAKFGWNWPNGSGEDENVKSLQIDRQTDGLTTDNRQSKKFTWTLSSDELKSDRQVQINGLSFTKLLWFKGNQLDI